MPDPIETDALVRDSHSDESIWKLIFERAKLAVEAQVGIENDEVLRVARQFHQGFPVGFCDHFAGHRGPWLLSGRG